MPIHAPCWVVRDRVLQITTIPLIMGILNLTPDSFSTTVPPGSIDDSGQFHVDPVAAADQTNRLEHSGADIIDLGAESTAPGSKSVSPAEQLRRIMPVLSSPVFRTKLPISVDTTSSIVARAVLEAGVAVINDISGATFDPEIIDVVRHYGAALCLGHIQGRPETMQENPRYNDVVAEVAQWLDERRRQVMAAGIPGNMIAIDPGIGFGKTSEQNLRIFAHIERFRLGDSPLLVGHSRKRIVRELSPGTTLSELDETTALCAGTLARKGVDVFRVHSPEHTRRALVNEVGFDDSVFEKAIQSKASGSNKLNTPDTRLPSSDERQ